MRKRQFTARQAYCQALASLFAAYETAPSTSINTAPLQQAIRQDQLRDQAFWGHLQEDAQEFLTHLLDRLHHELLEGEEGKVRGEDSAEGGWLEVGRGGTVGEYRRLEQRESALSGLLFGQYRSTVRRPGAKPSHCLEPFHCLTVEVSSRLEDSLAKLFSPERLEGGLGKQLALEKLPPILIIHLKRFVYQQGIQKLATPMTFPERLILQPGWHRETISNGNSRPCYRLASLVRHHGRGAAGGHYTAAVRSSWADGHPWWTIDDAQIRKEPETALLADHSTPYLLIYQRTRDAK